MVKNKRHSISEAGLRIARTAAFAFAILSWIATATGLKSYVYSNSAQVWLAYLGSFAIQGLLIVFNLKLPAFLTEAKWWCFAIVPFYFLVMAASVTFAFVFISNQVYEDTRYFDSQIILESEYRSTLDSTENYVKEALSYTRLEIAEKTASLAALVKDSGYNPPTEKQLKEALDQAKLVYDNAKSAREIAEKTSEDHWKIDHDGDYDNDPPPGYQDVDNANIRSAEAAENQAKIDYENAQEAYDNREEAVPLAQISNEILATILKSDIDDTTLEQAIDKLTNALSALSSIEVNITNYSSIVQTTQELTVYAKALVLLNNAESDIDKMTQLKTLSNDPPDPSIQTGEQFDNAKLLWIDSWKTRFKELKDIV